MKREDFLILLSFLLILEGYLGENVAPALLGVLLLLYVYGVRLSTRIEVSGERTVETTRLEEGKPVNAVLRLGNVGGDVFIRIREETPEFDAKPPELFLGAGEERTVTYSLVPKTKGRFTLKPPRVIALDPRGLYTEEFILGENLEVSVHPSLEAIRDAARADRNLRLAEAYRKGAFLGAESLEIKELREYQHGDDFKRIDWKATARIGELVVKDFLKEENADVYIFLDNTPEMRKGLRRAKIDYASTLALQLAANLVERFRVGMVIYDDARAEFIPPGKGSSQLGVIREKLSMRGKRGAMSLRFDLGLRMGEKAREFLSLVLPLKKGRRGSPGVFEGLSLIKSPSYIIFITDLSNPRELYRAVARAIRTHRVMVLSPNPVLFYSGRLDEKTLERLYRAYLEREELLRRFNLLAPTIDLGPSDYLGEIVKASERWKK